MIEDGYCEGEGPLGMKYNLNIGWKFIKEDVSDAYQITYDDSEWQTVSLPHTYNDTDTFDNFMEGGHNGERSMYTGKTWYRKEFKLEEADRDKKVLIEFEGVRQAAEVYINGQRLEGKSENGFIPFGYDLSPFVHFGADANVIAVMVDNSFPYMAEGTNAVLSWHDSHWHPTHGGIYRNVNLYVKDRLHVTLPLYSFLGTQGVYAYFQDLKEEGCKVGVEAEIRNEYANSQAAVVEALLLDRDNQVVLTVAQNVVLEADTLAVVKLNGLLTEPRRWSPEHPYLYTLQVRVLQEGKLLDTTEVPFGIRAVEFTHTQGFFLNGNHLKLKGWGQRPTNEWAGLGTAFPDWMHRHIQMLMKEAGANFLRWGHSAGAPADIRASDQLGILTIQPGVDGEGSTIGGVYSEDSYRVRSEAFRDMIIYFRNHPSIFIWEGGNQSVPDREAQTLRGIVDTWDPYGQRAFAHRRCDVNMAQYVDVSIGTEGSWELKSRNLPIVEGEYNREEAARRVWDRHTAGYKNYHTAPGSAYDLTSEDLAKNQAKHYKKISDPAHSGGANWIFSDSTSHGRVYSEVTRTSGVVDAVMLPKEAFYATKSIYREDPRLHIIGHWNYPAGTVKDLYVMANCAEVELLVNGISQGMGIRSDTYLFTFQEVAWVSGEVRAIGYDEDRNIVYQQSKITVGGPDHIKLTPWHSPNGLLADGADILHVDVEVLDANGLRVPTYEGTVQFHLEGPAIWRGGYNSGKEHSTNQMHLDLEAGINRIAVRTTRTAGTIRVTAEIAGLDSATVEVRSKLVTLRNGLTPYQDLSSPILLPEEPPVGPGPLGSADLDQAWENQPTIISDFSYSGFHETEGIRNKVYTGDLIYADEEEEFKWMPEFLANSEYILLPNKDRNYKALDLIHFSVNVDATLFIAHDDSLERPEWLQMDFEETEAKLFIKGHLHTVFRKYLPSDSTITLGGNEDTANSERGNMYVIFVKEYEEDLVIPSLEAMMR